jgi:hypothetical protein
LKCSAADAAEEEKDQQTRYLQSSHLFSSSRQRDSRGPC